MGVDHDGPVGKGVLNSNDLLIDNQKQVCFRWLIVLQEIFNLVTEGIFQTAGESQQQDSDQKEFQYRAKTIQNLFTFFQDRWWNNRTLQVMDLIQPAPPWGDAG